MECKRELASARRTNSISNAASIGEFLVGGKKGAELDITIQECDKHHVPEIITHFETLISVRIRVFCDHTEEGGFKKSQYFLLASFMLNRNDGMRKVRRLTRSKR